MIANLFYNIHRAIYSSAPRLLSSTLLHSANEVRPANAAAAAAAAAAALVAAAVAAAVVVAVVAVIAVLIVAAAAVVAAAAAAVAFIAAAYALYGFLNTVKMLDVRCPILIATFPVLS
jgi:hypothetical protein